MSEDCEFCGARPRHQRLVERICRNPLCIELFDVLTNESRQRYCSRKCQIEGYRSN
jgi:hypothetical protein